MTGRERIKRLADEVRARREFVNTIPRPCPPELRQIVQTALADGGRIRTEIEQARQESLAELGRLEKMRDGLEGQLPVRRPLLNCLG